MKNVKIFQFRDIADSKGHLTPIEADQDIPFLIKRIYYITRVPNYVTRGFHSHRALQQVLICVNGSVKILVKTPFEQQIVTLNNSAKGLYIGPMIWREMFDFSEGAVLLVLASEHYIEDDYIRDYTVYDREARNYFKKEINNPQIEESRGI